MDYIRAINSIGATIEKVAEPLTDNQKSALVGALAVWLDAAIKEGRQVAPTDNGIQELDSICELYNEGEIDLGTLVCNVWNTAIKKQKRESS